MLNPNENKTQDITNNAFSTAFQNKIFFYFILISATVFTLLKLPMAAIYYQAVSTALTFAPFIVIAVMGSIALVNIKKHPDYTGIIRKFYLTFTLKLLFAILVFYFLYAPFLFITPLIAGIKYLQIIVTLEGFFYFLSYALILAIVIAVVFVAFKAYQKTKGTYGGSIRHLIRKTLYALFLFFFLALGASVAAYPEAYKPLTNTLGDTIYTLSAGNVQVFKGDDLASYKKIKSLKEFTGSLSASLAETSQNISQSNQTFKTNLDQATSDLQNSITQTTKDLKNKINNDVSGALSTDGGTIDGGITVSGDITAKGDLDMRGNLILDVRDPINLQDAATKNYVDAQVAAVPSLWELTGSVLSPTTANNLVNIGSGALTAGGATLNGTLNSQNITPLTDSAYDLGSASKYFSKGYIDDLYLSSTLRIGTTSSSFDIGLGGDGDRAIGMARASLGAGHDLTISAGAAANSSDNSNGGDLILQAGNSRGTGSSNIEFWTGTKEAVGKILTISSTFSAGVCGGFNTVGETLTISGGDGNATVRVESISGTWDTVASVSLLSGGTGYSAGATTFGGDVDCTIDILTATGIYDAALSKKMVINGDGEVGIGLDTPTSLLHVYGMGATNFDPLLTIQNSDLSGLSSMQFGGTGDYTFQVGVVGSTSSEYIPGTFIIQANDGMGAGILALDTSGNFGIGTNSPQALLHMISVDPVMILQKGISASGGQINFYGDSFGSITYGNRINSASGVLTFLTDSTPTDTVDNLTERMRIAANGNVGIGVTPGNVANFLVGQSTAGVGTVTITGNTTCTGTGTQFANTFKVGDSIIITATGETRAITNIASATVMTIASATNTVASAYTLDGGKRFSVLGNGNVGIGTITPGYPLDIQSTVKMNSKTGYLTDGADYAEHFYSKDTDLKAGEVVCVDTQNDNAVKRCTNDGDNNVMGIVSTKPAVVGNNSEEARNNPKNYPVIAMLGQIPGYVETTTENAENITIGDALTASQIPGYLRKAKAGESTVGVALQNATNNKQTIQILISRKNKSLTVDAVETQVTQRIAEMNVQDQVNALISQGQKSLDEKISSKLTTLDANIATIQDLNAKLSAQIDAIRELTQANADLTNTMVSQIKKLVNGINIDAENNIQILGQLTAQTLETGKMIINIKEGEDATIGTAYICPVGKIYNEMSKNCDDNERGDGKSVEVQMENKIKNNSKIFTTAEEPVAVGVSRSGDGKGFKLNLSEAVSKMLKIDWWIVEEQKN